MKSKKSILGYVIRLMVATLVVTHVAPALAGPVSREFVRADSLSSAQRGEISEWITAQMASLSSDDPAEYQEGKVSLLSPFDGREKISVAFRLEFGRLVMSDVRRMITGPSVQQSITASLIAGKCGTPEMIEPLGQGLEDPRPAVRSGAAAGLREVIQQVVDGVLQLNVGEQAVDQLLAGAARETDLTIATMIMIGLGEARGSDLHGRVTEGVIVVLPDQITNLENPNPGAKTGRYASVIGRSLDVLFAWMIDPNQIDGQDDAFLMKAAETAARALATGSRTLQNPSPGAYWENESGTRLRSMLATAEQILLLSEGRLRGEPPSSASIPSVFDSVVRMNDARRLDERIDMLLGIVSDLTDTDFTRQTGAKE